MDFYEVAEDVAAEAYGLIKRVIGWSISPERKKTIIASLLGEIAVPFTDKLYGDISFLVDSAAIHSTVIVDENDQIATLAQRVVRDSAFELDDQRIVQEFFDTLVGRAADVAVKNANSLQKHPTVDRSIVGETCDWCQKLAGHYVNPDSEVFARHDDCDCRIVVSGYNSRNGVVRNYTKASKASKFIDQNGQTVGWDDRLRRIEAGETSTNFIKVKE